MVILAPIELVYRCFFLCLVFQGGWKVERGRLIVVLTKMLWCCCNIWLCEIQKISKALKEVIVTFLFVKWL